MTFPQALLPKLNKLTRYSLPLWRASVPGFHPPRSCLPCNVGLAAAVECIKLGPCSPRQGGNPRLDQELSWSKEGADLVTKSGATEGTADLFHHTRGKSQLCKGTAGVMGTQRLLFLCVYLQLFLFNSSLPICVVMKLPYKSHLVYSSKSSDREKVNLCYFSYLCSPNKHNPVT